MILKVGLTGGTASGKSTVARLLGEMGCIVIDADEVVRDLYRPGQRGHRALVQRFGTGILTPKGEIDRNRVAEMTFDSPERTAELNALIHPLVIAREREMVQQFEQQRAGEDLIVVVEATLLIESGGRERYDRIIVVEASREVQIERAVQRGMNRADAERRIARQMPPQKRLEVADYVVRNDGDIQALAVRVRELHAALQRDLRALKSK